MTKCLYLFFSCTRGFCTTYSLYLLASIFVGTWRIIIFIPCWMKEFPKQWGWKENGDNDGDNFGESNGVRKTKVVNNFINYHKESENSPY